MGTCAPPGRACNRLNSSNPLRSGKPTSRMASAGGCAANSRRAASAVLHHTGANPSVASTYWIVSAMPDSSSTTRMRCLLSMAYGSGLAPAAPAYPGQALRVLQVLQPSIA